MSERDFKEFEGVEVGSALKASMLGERAQIYRDLLQEYVDHAHKKNLRVVRADLSRGLLRLTFCRPSRPDIEPWRVVVGHDKLETA